MERKRRWKYRLIKFMRYTNKLTSYQKLASRIGYMGAGFVIAGQWTIEPVFFIMGFICVIVQTSSPKKNDDALEKLKQKLKEDGEKEKVEV